MPLTKITLGISALIFFISVSKAQDSCILKQAAKLKQFVEQNVSTNNEAYTSTESEYFMLDIKLNDVSGTIEMIDFLRKSNSQHFLKIQALIEKLRVSWNQQPCQYHRLLVPIFVLFPNTDKLSDTPPDFILNPSNKDKKTYLLNMIVIPVYTPVQRKTSS